MAVISLPPVKKDTVKELNWNFYLFLKKTVDHCNTGQFMKSPNLDKSEVLFFTVNW